MSAVMKREPLRAANLAVPSYSANVIWHATMLARECSATARPLRTLARVIPFLPAPRPGLRQIVQRVPIAHIVGGLSMDVKVAGEAMDRFLSGEGTADSAANVVLAKPFGLYWQVDSNGGLPAWLAGAGADALAATVVTVLDYPAADRLQIHMTDWNSVVVSLDGRWLFPLTVCVGAALSLLEEYGVEIDTWPKGVRCNRDELARWCASQSCLDEVAMPPIDGRSDLKSRK